MRHSGNSSVEFRGIRQYAYNIINYTLYDFTIDMATQFKDVIKYHTEVLFSEVAGNKVVATPLTNDEMLIFQNDAIKSFGVSILPYDDCEGINNDFLRVFNCSSHPGSRCNVEAEVDYKRISN